MNEKKLVHLPGTKLSAAMVLGAAMEKLPNTRAVLVCEHHEDETFSWSWSNMKMNDLCMALVMLQNEVAKATAD